MKYKAIVLSLILITGFSGTALAQNDDTISLSPGESTTISPGGDNSYTISVSAISQDGQVSLSIDGGNTKTVSPGDSVNLVGSDYRLSVDVSGNDALLTPEFRSISTGETPGMEEAWGVLFTFIRIIQGAVGLFALYYAATAGLKLQHAGENPQKAQEAKKTLLYAVGGIILVIAAPFLLRTLIVEPYLLNVGA